MPLLDVKKNDERKQFYNFSLKLLRYLIDVIDRTSEEKLEQPVLVARLGKYLVFFYFVITRSVADWLRHRIPDSNVTG